MSTGCNHTFCHECILHALSRSDSCPLCKTHVHKRGLNRVDHLEQVIEAFNQLKEAFEQEDGQSKCWSDSPCRLMLPPKIGFSVDQLHVPDTMKKLFCFFRTRLNLQHCHRRLGILRLNLKRTLHSYTHTLKSQTNLPPVPDLSQTFSQLLRLPQKPLPLLHVPRPWSLHFPSVNP